MSSGRALHPLTHREAACHPQPNEAPGLYRQVSSLLQTLRLHRACYKQMLLKPIKELAHTLLCQDTGSSPKEAVTACISRLPKSKRNLSIRAAAL